MRIIGIDPGAQGGMACFLEDANGPDVFKFTNATEADIADRLREWSESGCIKCYLERVWASRGSGDRTMGASTMFTFGQNYGFVRGVLIALGIPFEEVLPAKWQATFSLKRTDPNETDTAKKNRHKAKAQQLFPTLKVTHAVADAILIAEHARRVEWERYLALALRSGGVLA